MKSGADKIAINTQAIKNPTIIKEASRIYGSQCIVGSIEAKRRESGKWEAYIDNGREETGIDALEWAKELEQLGAGELVVTSVDQEGTKKGFDLELVKEISRLVSIPVIASGGAGDIVHIKEVANQTQIGAVAIASIIHYEMSDIPTIKSELKRSGIEIRL